MKLKTALRQTSMMGLAIVLSAGGATSAYAAPGTIADSPLFLTNYPQANIFFMLDDSGSMDWEIMVQGNGGRFATNQPDGTNLGSAGAIQQRVTTNSGSGNCATGGYSGTYIYGVEFGNNTYSDGSADCNTADDQAWRFRNSDFNPLYFDPTKDYTPWYGWDANGNKYTDVPITNAPDDPYRYNYATDPSETIDLTLHNSNWAGGTTRDASTGNGFWFYTWDDTDGDTFFDNNANGDTVVGYRIGNISQAQINAAGWTNPAGAVNAGSIKTVAELQQDFANWFSYYRSREYVVKRAVSELMYNSQVRLGMSSLHNNNSVGTPIKDVDNISTPVNATAQTNKENLLDNLAQVNSTGGTPLRIGLRNVGNYFDTSTSTGVSSLFGATHSSPILPQADGGECQQNFTILLSDGFWNGSTSPGVGDTDADGPGPFDGGSHADGFGNDLADVAMHYYETDLATSLADKVPVTVSVDENNAQHMVTYTVAFGINGQTSCDPDPAQRATPVTAQGWPEICTNASFTGTGSGWPDGVSDTLTTIDDMRHAAWNGRGKFLSAGDPQSLIDAMTDAIKDIGKRVGSAAAVSFNSTSLQAGSLVYQAKFDSAGWHGDLIAWSITSGGIGSMVWEAAAKLDGRNLTTYPRQIVTYNGTAGIPFTWPADWQSPSATELSSSQIADLLANAPYSLTTTVPAEITANDAFGQELLDFLKGSHANEGSGSDEFRERQGHRLGDIVHSGPFFVGPPNTPYPNDIEPGHPYSSYALTWAARDGMVYVGSNDGMLHVFESSGTTASPNPDDGEEVFAYMPGFLFSDQAGEGYHQLAEHGYVHDYYVDLSPTAADVFVGGSWKTYLIGGARAGGKGIFVLDITDPSNLTASQAASVVKMEFTHADLGFTFSEIRVGRMNNGKWAAIFGNGYNNTGDGTAKLFVLYLDGSGYQLLETKVGSNTDLNGMSTPAVADMNGDGTIDRIVAGDLKGNLWVFDVTATSPSSWGPAYGSVASPTPLYTACSDAAGSSCTTANRQPITSEPSLARHPTQKGSDTYPNLMIFFGTGQYLTQNDNSTTQLQRFYGVWDDGGNNPGTNPAPYDHNDLQVQTITETTFTVGPITYDIRTLSGNSVNWSTRKGWYMDLPTSMERIVVASAVVGDIVFFNTMIPETDVCSQGGYSWLMAVGLENGGEPPFTVLDVNGDGTWDASDMSGGVQVSGAKTPGIATESKYLPGDGKVIQVTSDSTGGITTKKMQVKLPEDPKRMSWTLQEY
jgi:type IV pilus assembly protein PilY1